MEKRFRELLLNYATALHDADRKAIEQTLWQTFGKTRAVFVLDMSGFSLLCRRYGVVHYLSMVRRMQMAAQPVIEQYGGLLVKFEADNCFAAFEDVLPAVQAALALNATLNGMNMLTADEFDIRVSIGIDYGDILLIGDGDYFGDAVNAASKLGEDIAGAGEILLTQRAFERLPVEAGFHGQPQVFHVSGVELPAVSIVMGAAGLCG